MPNKTIDRGLWNLHRIALNDRRAIDFTSDGQTVYFHNASGGLVGKVEGKYKITLSLGLVIPPLSASAREKETDRFVQITNLIRSGLDAFGDPAKFKRWMASPRKGLGGICPMEMLDTAEGIESVKVELGRAEHGVF
jgi:Protein of unknown function (DUF2384)